MKTCERAQHVSGQLHAFATLLLREEHQCPLNRRLGPRACLNIIEYKSLALQEIKLWPPQL
jgi:hypothetical protein